MKTQIRTNTCTGRWMVSRVCGFCLCLTNWTRQIRNWNGYTIQRSPSAVGFFFFFFLFSLRLSCFACLSAHWLSTRKQQLYSIKCYKREPTVHTGIRIYCWRPIKTYWTVVTCIKRHIYACIRRAIDTEYISATQLDICVRCDADVV